MTTSLLNLSKVKLTKAEEDAAALLTANYEVLQKNLGSKTKEELVQALAFEVHGRKRMQIAQRIGARLGSLMRQEIEAEIIEALQTKEK